MKVSDILRVKGSTLYTVRADEPLADAVNTMAEKDIGSLVVMDHGELTGMLTFREVIQRIVRQIVVAPIGVAAGGRAFDAIEDGHGAGRMQKHQIGVKLQFRVTQRAKIGRAHV